MLGQDSSKKMNNRSGLPIKNIVTAIFILLSIYLLYIYNVAQNHLHDAEMTGSRYRREAEEKANEIQGLISAKDDCQDRCETEKRELNNRLKSVNQKLSMSQSQKTELEADFSKLKQDMENLRTEHMQVESQHAQEYQALKQAKEKEVTDLTEELARIKKQNEDLQATITTLHAQIQSYETAKKNLLDQNAKLHILQFQQQKQLELQMQNEENAQKAKLLQQQQKQMNAVSEQLQNQEEKKNIFDLGNSQDRQNVNMMSQNINNGQEVDPVVGNNNFGQNENKPSEHQANEIDELNAMNQAKPPSFNANVNHDEDKGNEDKNGEEQRPEINPNDLQKGQILEPLKEDGGEVDTEGRMNMREEEEKREVEEMEKNAAEHNRNPLDLGQMQQPMDLRVGVGNGLDIKDNKFNQQQPPVLVENKHIDNNEAELEDDQRQYYRNREEDNEEEIADDDDDDEINDLDDKEKNALDINDNVQDKAVNDQLNAWQHFNLAPPAFGNDNVHHIGNINNNGNNIDGGKYDDKEEEEDDAVEDVEEDDVNADDDYGANIDGAAADGPLNGAAVDGPLNGADV